MLATTSADRRNPICTLGVSAFGRPVFPRWRSIASTSSGIASRIGFILRISARVSSRTSPSSSIGGPFRLGSLIAPHLSIVCLAQADDPKCVASDAEASDVQPSFQEDQRPVAILAVVTPRVRFDDAGFEIEVQKPVERSSVLLAVLGVFGS